MGLSCRDEKDNTGIFQGTQPQQFRVESVLLSQISFDQFTTHSCLSAAASPGRPINRDARWPAVWRMCMLAESNGVSLSSVQHGDIVAVADRDRSSDLNKCQEKSGISPVPDTLPTFRRRISQHSTHRQNVDGK